MTAIRRDVQPTLGRRDGMRPRSPAEVLEPGRGPARPRDASSRQPSRAVSGFARVVSGLFTLALVGMLTAGGLTLLSKHVYERPGPLTAAQTAVIPKGSSTNEIAERLEREGVVSSRWAFMAGYLVQTRVQGADLTLKHGEYLFKPGASIRDVIAVLAEGKSLSYKITIPEGLTSQQIVERLNAEPSLSGEIAKMPEEGVMLPETYAIEKGMSRQEIVDRMTSKQAAVLAALWEKRRPDVPFKTPHEALVLASIVEKETGRADEREKIAGVFINRLKKNMALQSDPTILYGAYGGAVQWGKPILQSEKEAKNAHNTYQMKGLPQTPICNVGRAAIEAVLEPADTSDLYFVADGEGGHIFSATLDQHNAAVVKWRKVEKEIREREAAAEPAAAAGNDIPSPPAVDPGAAAVAPKGSPVTTVPADTPVSLQASSIPLPVRKPKR